MNTFPTTVVQQTKAPSQSFAISSLAKATIGDIKKLNAKIKEIRAQIKSNYLQDARFHDADEDVKASQKVRNAIKKELDSVPAIQALHSHIKELRLEKKDQQISLSDYLLQLDKDGLSTVEDDTGKIYKIEKRANIKL